MKGGDEEMDKAKLRTLIKKMREAQKAKKALAKRDGTLLRIVNIKEYIKFMRLERKYEEQFVHEFRELTRRK